MGRRDGSGMPERRPPESDRIFAGVDIPATVQAPPLYATERGKLEASMLEENEERRRYSRWVGMAVAFFASAFLEAFGAGPLTLCLFGLVSILFCVWSGARVNEAIEKAKGQR